MLYSSVLVGEQDDDARSALKATIVNLDQYDTIFVGYADGIIGIN